MLKLKVLKMTASESKKFDMILFLLITFLFSWLVWLPSVLESQGIITLPAWVGLVTNIATFGPMIGAIIVVGIRSGKHVVKNLLAKLIKTKFRRFWWIVIFLLAPITTGLSYVITVPLTGDTWTIGFMWSTLVNVIIMFFVGGPLGEELGWRGFALEYFQRKYSALVSSLVIGFIWGIWHLPLHFMIGSTQWYIPIWAFILLQMVMSIIYTWIYNNTGSVLAAMIFHWAGNAAAMLIPFWQKGFISIPAFPNYIVNAVGQLDVYSLNMGVIFTQPNYWIPSVGMLLVFFINLMVAIAIILSFKTKSFRREKTEN